MTYVKSFRTSALLFLFPFFAYGQQIDSTELLREVVVQATRAGNKSPIPHNNLNAEKIAQTLQAQDVPMLLTAIPSLVETSDAGTGIGYTGLRIRGSDPTRVNVTINGVPLNDAESQGVFWVDLPDLAASAAEIQVQRGVGASSNGAGAFGATVNLDLSKVLPNPGASVSSTIGSFGTKKISAQANTGLLANKWSFFGRASGISSDGYIDRGAAALKSLHLSAAYLGERQTLQAHLLSGHERTYQTWNGTPVQFIDDKARRTYNTAGTERPGEPYDEEVDDYGQQHLLLHYKRILSPQLILQLNGHYTKGGGYYEQYKADEAYADYGLPGWVLGDTVIETTDLIRRRWLDNDFYGGTFALRWTPSREKNTSFLLGGALSQYQGRHFGEIIWAEQFIGVPKDFRYYDNSAEKRDGNVFLKVEKSFSKNFRAFADLQTRHVGYAFLGFNNELLPTDQTVAHFFFNPKVGLTYSISDNWNGYGFFGIAHREPNRDDYTQSTPTSRPKAERLADTELGLRFEDKKISFTANCFFMQYHNQLVLDGRINDVGAYIRTNVPASYRAGLELEASATLNSRFSMAGNFSLSQNKVKAFSEFRDDWDTGLQEVFDYKNTDLAFSPNMLARAALTSVLWRKAGQESGGIAVVISGKYVGKQFLDNTANDRASLPGYFFSDLRLNADFDLKSGQSLGLILSINNWLDARYASNGWVYRYTSAGYDARPDDPYTQLEGGAVYSQMGLFPQAGRNLMLTLRFGF
jgi:iron complex outermembrane recepter protein